MWDLSISRQLIFVDKRRHTDYFIFFGDDTSSAQANVNFRSAEVIPVPEPSVALGLLALAAFGVFGAVVARK